MGPLVYYCRWREAKLRLRGRDERSVWGQLVLSQDEGGRLEPFRFDLQTWELTLGEGEATTNLQLDELGVVVSPDSGAGTTTSAGAEP